MNIYFAGAIRGGREDARWYHELVGFLKTIGHVPTEHVGDPALTRLGDDGPDDRSIYDRDMRWLAACDLVVAEVTVPSLGVGFELGRAVAVGKPVLCLHRSIPGRPLSAMIAGCDRIRTRAYATLDEARAHIGAFIDELR